MPSPQPPAAAVTAWINTLPPAQAAVVLPARAIIHEAVPTATESIKWAAASFATTEHFATFRVSGRGNPPPVQLILHLGARVRTTAQTGVDVPDPEGLLTWLAKDRAMLVLPDAAWVDARRGALRELLAAWAAWV